MSPKFANFELIILYLLLLIPWPNTQFMKYICSKDNSRLVRKIVRSKWMPILDKYQVKLPLDCPLHPLRDIFAPRQDAKKRDRPTQWTCRLCGKSFYTEKFLDEHFERRHQQIINQAEDAICLDDFCDILRCDIFQSEEAASLKTQDQHIVTDIEVWGDSLGRSSVLARPNTAYLNLLPIKGIAAGSRKAQSISHNCEDALADREYCVSAEKSNAKSVSSGGTLISTPTQTKYDETKKTTTSIGKEQTAATNAKKTKNTTSTENTTQADGNSSEQGETSVPKMRANCKSEELSKLKTKCEFLVRSCIGGLLLSMNDQSFKEMEGNFQVKDIFCLVLISLFFYFI